MKEIQQFIITAMMTAWFWGSLIVMGVLLESIALYYQYSLNELPCVLCIHFRLLISGLIIIGFLGVLLRKYQWGRGLLSLSLLLLSIGMLERAYQLVGTERGFVIGECSMSLGLPQWLAVDQWIPWLFGVQTTCGYTPIIVGNISMAESLMAMSVVLCLSAIVMLLLLFKRNP